jgi:hypothetical protein
MGEFKKYRKNDGSSKTSPKLDIMQLQDALQMHRKTGNRKFMELIANAIASVGFNNEKAAVVEK